MSAAEPPPGAGQAAGARLPPKPARPRPTAAKAWVPERQDVIWIDCNPQAGDEMRDLHPMLVLSPGAFNARTGLVIGLPMTTAAYNATNPFALAVGVVGAERGVAAGAAGAAGNLAGNPVDGRKAGKTSYVLCHQPKSFDWQARGAKPHAQGKLADTAFAQACAMLNQIIQIE